MSVTYDSFTVDRNRFRLEYSSDLGGTPTFYRYRDGRLVDTTTAGVWEGYVADGETPVLEVLDSASATPETAYPGRVNLGWYGSDGVDYYRVDEYISGAWTQRKRIRDNGEGYFSWESRWLEDMTSHQFRVVAVGDNGNEATAASFVVLMVRHPDPPEPAWSYDEATRRVTVTVDGTQHTTAALDVAPAGTERTYHFVLRRRNRFDLVSKNTDEWTLTVDDTGARITTYPSAPTEIAAVAAAAGAVNVTAWYAYIEDAGYEATQFVICYTTDGSDPDVSTDTIEAVSMIKADGRAHLDHDLGPFADATTVRLIVGTRRVDTGPANRDTWDSTIYTVIADTDGPAAPAPAGAFLGTVNQQEQ